MVRFRRSACIPQPCHLLPELWVIPPCFTAGCPFSGSPRSSLALPSHFHALGDLLQPGLTVFSLWRVATALHSAKPGCLQFLSVLLLSPQLPQIRVRVHEALFLFLFCSTPSLPLVLEYYPQHSVKFGGEEIGDSVVHLCILICCISPR